MERLQIDILGVSEMRWPDSGKFQINGYYISYSRSNSPQHWNVVGITISQTIDSRNP